MAALLDRPVRAAGPPPGRTLLGLLCAVQLLVMADTAVLNVALPSLGAALHAGPAGLGWVVDAYVVAFAGLLLLGGRLADRLGARRVLLTGLTSFTSAALAGGLSPSVPALVLARGVQGVGAALAVPAALALLTSAYAGEAERRWAMAAWTAVAGGGAAAGAVLGGVLTAVADWRWIFLAQVPAGLVVARLLARLTPRPAARSAAAAPAGGPLLVVAGLVLLVVGLLHAGPDLRTAGTVGSAGALLALAARAERHARDPLLPAVLHTRRCAAVWGTALLLGAAGLSTVYGLTVQLQVRLGWSPVRTGVALLALTVPIVLLTPVARRLLATHPARAVLALGLLAGAAGRLLLAAHPSGAALSVGLVLVGTGTSLALVALGVLAVRGAGAAGALAAAAFTTALQTGAALGVALAAPLTASAGPRAVFLLGALLGAGGLLLAPHADRP